MARNNYMLKIKVIILHGAYLIYIFEPLSHIGKRIFSADIIDKDHTLKGDID